MSLISRINEGHFKGHNEIILNDEEYFALFDLLVEMKKANKLDKNLEELYFNVKEF